MASKARSIQLRFKRADVALTQATHDLTLEAPLELELRGVLQRYGEWEFLRLQEGSEGIGVNAGVTGPPELSAGEENGHTTPENEAEVPGSECQGTDRDAQRPEQEGGSLGAGSEEASKHWEHLNFRPDNLVRPFSWHSGGKARVTGS